jgi:glycosyltransferase involved in cell wall biosynthesis
MLFLKKTKTEFGKLSIIAPIYNYWPILVPSCVLQTYKNWELFLIHDGPDTIGLDKIVEKFDDSRIILLYSLKRYNDWGHSLREIALDYAVGEFLLHTNADNYYVPTAFDVMLSSFDWETLSVYCDMVHNYKQYDLVNSRLKFSHIDCGSAIFRTEIAKEIGWPSKSVCSDWDMIKLVVTKYGEDVFSKINKPLFIHN